MDKENFQKEVRKALGESGSSENPGGGN